MTSPILFAGGEDLNFSLPYGGAFLSGQSQTIGCAFPDATAGAFRSGYARNAIELFTSGLDTSHYLRASFASTTSFWISFRMTCKSANGAGASAATCIPVRFVDSTGVVRLYLKFTGSAASPNDTFQIFTQNAAGASVQIGSTSPGRFATAFNSGNFGNVDKIDIFVNYATSGQFTVYLNGTQSFTFSGDVTTNSTTTLAGLELGGVTNNFLYTAYSEVIVATRDTRNFSLVTQAPTANGNTHNWDGGTAANAASASMLTGQASPQFSGSTGQIQEYQVTPAIPTGNFSVISVVQTAQATIGSGGPQHFEFMVRTGATDYTSTPDAAPTPGWTTFSYNWDTNPNTSASWLTTDLPASSTSFNLGMKSIT